MITNNLLLKLKDRSGANIEQVRSALLSMRGKIEFLRDLKVEVNIRQGAAAYDIIMIAQYDSMAGFEAYLVHPVHVEVSQYIASVLAASASVCYES
ncbi:MULTISPECIES: Dabb family protein [Sporomusa]|uniref:Dabb family protein n=1 Tax=Sporomusa TaxID=2375 RepID=UPI001663BF8A|nr:MULTISPECIES: Dabb family protein [Sporomusa]HML33754.1 Dabb family protein [Sporomusa sphaeroides]